MRLLLPCCLFSAWLIGSAWSFLAQLAARLPLPGKPSPPGSPWPIPRNWNQSSTVFTLSGEKFSYNLSIDDCDVLNQAVQRYNFWFLIQETSVTPAQGASYGKMLLTMMLRDVVVQVWKDEAEKPWQSYMQRLLDRNYTTLLSSCWYLNYISYGQTWMDYYECDPELSLPDPLPEWQRKLILGGEAAIWGEYVDGTNLVSRLFPFVGAVAEKLWSPPNSSSTDDAMWRLDEHRCRMLGRGTPAQPIFNGYCFPQEARLVEK